MRKIVIIGSNHKSSLENIYKYLLEEEGYSVVLFPANSIFTDYYNISIFNKITYALGLSSILKKIQFDIKCFITNEKPDIVLIFKGMELLPSTLKWIKEQGIKLMNYNPDHPFIFSGRGSGNKNVSQSIQLYDYYFSYADDVVDQLKILGIKSIKIPFGFDYYGFEYHQLLKEDEIKKTCFLGNADNERVAFINQLAELGIEVDVYGENWNQFKTHSLVKKNTAKYGLEFWSTLQKYAIQLNLLRLHNLHTHNMRSFDIPGAGGIMLAPYTDDHASFFKNGEEIFLFNNLEEAYKKILHLINLTFEERQKIRSKARLRSIDNHTYQQRVNCLIYYFEK